MRGMKLEDLLAIVDFLYFGEANIYQENLDSFLNIAEELQFKGLNGRDGGGGGGKGDGETSQPAYQSIIPSPFEQKKNDTFEAKICSQENSFLSQSYSEGKETSSKEVAVVKQHFSGDIQELDEQIEMMIGRGGNLIKGNGKGLMGKVYVCQSCGKEGTRTNIKHHIQANHIKMNLFPMHSL